MSRAVKEYHEVGVQTSVISADPYRLIQMLMDGALNKMAVAKGCMQHQQIEQKGLSLSMAISIIGGLQSSLNRDEGGEIAQNLYYLYDYMMGRLIEANLNNDPHLINEVAGLMITLKSGWDGIVGNKV